MAIRMQQRRGTAAQWVSSNAGAGPILNAGEIGWESDTNKFKIGDGTNNWSSLTYFVDATDVIAASLGGYVEDSDIGAISGVAGLNADQNVKTKTGIEFEGATADSFETFVVVTDPTADRTITLPDATGTVALTTDITVTASSTNTLTNKSISLGSNTVTSTLAQLNTAVSDADVASLAGTETLTNKTLTSPVINTPTGITKSDVGLANVDNTTDANKPVSTATQTALDLKANTASPTFTGTVAGITSTMVGLGNVDNTSDANKPVSTATQTALDLKANLAGPTFTGTISAAALTLSGDLTVNGTTTTINSTTLVVDDKNITLGDVATPSDVTADGGGITLKGATDKTFNWVDATDAWTSSEHLNLASGKTLKYNGTDLVASQSGNSGKYLTTDGTSTSWGTVEGYSAPTIGSTSIASGATVTTIAGLTLTSPVLTTPSISTIDAVGDLLIGTADNTIGKISIGANGYLLTSNGTTASWQAAAPSGAAFSELMLIGA
jgi:hypothetical protein